MPKRFRTVLVLGLALLAAGAGGDKADAQTRRAGGGNRGAARPALELAATYGHMWGGHIDLSWSGWGQSRTIRAGTGPALGISLAYELNPMQAVELNWTSQDGSLDYDYQGLRTLTGMSVNYWQIGSTRMLTPPGGPRPFLLLSLGITHYSFDDATVQIEGETFQTSSATKFSMVIGAGLKHWFGAAERVGIRATFKVMPTIYDGGAGLWFGTGGGGITVGGSALWQYEAAGGLTVRFGG